MEEDGMKELKKCPICGGNLTIENYNGEEINLKFRDMEKEDEYTAFCSCGFSFGLYDITLMEFLDRLNTRKPMERVVERLEVCQDRLKTMPVWEAIEIVKEELN